MSALDRALTLGALEGRRAPTVQAAIRTGRALLACPRFTIGEAAASTFFGMLCLFGGPTPVEADSVELNIKSVRGCFRVKTDVAGCISSVSVPWATGSVLF